MGLVDTTIKLMAVWIPTTHVLGNWSILVILFFGPKPLTLNSYIDVECDEVGDTFAMLVIDLTV